MLLYRGAADPVAGPAGVEPLFARAGWGGSWRDGIFPYHHFHSTAHEVLGIAAGEVDVVLGGPDGERVSLRAGDVVVLPAGTGHRNVGSGAGLVVVGAYPAGQRWDLRRGDPAELAEVQENLSRVPLPGTDPVTGGDGPLLAHWR